MKNRDNDNRPFGEEGNREGVSNPEHKSTGGLAKLTREDLTYNNELEDVDEQGLDNQSGQEAQRISTERPYNGDDDYQDENPGFNKGHTRDEGESYTDYNGNSEQNAPVK